MYVSTAYHYFGSVSRTIILRCSAWTKSAIVRRVLVCALMSDNVHRNRRAWQCQCNANANGNGQWVCVAAGGGGRNRRGSGKLSPDWLMVPPGDQSDTYQVAAYYRRLLTPRAQVSEFIRDDPLVCWCYFSIRIIAAWLVDVMVMETTTAAALSSSPLVTCVSCCVQLEMPYIRCAECPLTSADLCLRCFSRGAETSSHRSEHRYQVIVSQRDRLLYPTVLSHWYYVFSAD